MKLLRWSPDQRVDIPDITALSFLIQGEFRRMSREILTGGPAELSPLHMRILRGFEPEQDGNTLRVKLDILGTGALLSAALGAHAHGTAAGAASRAEYGQLIGGHGFNFDFEGNSENSIDFSARDDGTYVVRMRFLFGTSDTDNRAFWNPTANQETVQSVETRHAPIWEIRDDLTGVNPPSPVEQWINVAEVDVASNAITAVRDLRDFAFEGKAPFESADQTATFGPYPGNYLSDTAFDRSSDRSDVDAGINTVYPALRALARQILDLKGQDETGNFNWFGKVFRAATTMNAASSKSLRTVDHVTFTVGDGTTEWGDFNGTSGLSDCLDHIATNLASMPDRITIYLKSRAKDDPDLPLWTITSSKLLTGKNIEIIGTTGGTRGRGHSIIDISAPNGIRFSEDATEGVGSLLLRNIEARLNDVSSAITLGWDEVTGLPGRFVAENCFFVGGGSATSDQIRAPSRDLKIENCIFAATRIQFRGSGRGALPTTETGQFGIWAGSVRSTVFSEVSIVGRSQRNTVLIADFAAAQRRFADGILFEQCSFSWASAAFKVDTSDSDSFVDFMGCVGVAFRQCDFRFDGDIDQCLLLGAAELGDGSLRPSVDCLVERCRFYQDTTGTPGQHGYGVAIKNWEDHVPEADKSTINEWNRGIKIIDCAFEAQKPSTASFEFGVFAQYLENSDICRNRFLIDNSSLENDVAQAMFIKNISASRIDDNYIKCSTKDATHHFVGINLQTAVGVKIRGNDFDGATEGGTFTGPLGSGLSRALSLSSVSYSHITGNTFSFHAIDGTRTSQVCVLGVVVHHTVISDNTFLQCFGNVISLGGSTIRNNRIEGNHFSFHDFVLESSTILDMLPRGSTPTDGAVISLRSATTNTDGLDDNGAGDTIVMKNKFLNNSWDLHDTGAGVQADAYRAIHAGSDRYASFVGNHFFDGLLVLKDYATPALPDANRSFGWSTALNLVGGVGYSGYLVE